MFNFRSSLATTLALGALGASQLFSQSEISTSAASAEDKLNRALSQLTDLRKTIETEKVPMSVEREQLFNELQSARREADRSQRLSDNQSASLSSLEANNKAQKEMVDYLINLSAEFARSLGAQLDPSEVGQYTPAIEAAERAAEDPFITPLEKIGPQLTMIETGLKRMESLVGGASYPGKAIMPGGLFEEGTFVRFGPVTYFASTSGGAGISRRGEASEPTVVAVADGAFDKGIIALAGGSQATIPTDPTLGNAIAIAATRETVMEHIQKGGLWVWPILGFAGISLIIGLFKAFEIYTLPKPKSGTLAAILSALSDGDTSKAAAIAGEAPGPIGSMLQQGVRYWKHEPELVEEILYEQIIETQPKVMRLLPFISVTAAVAPLLGLLGTVTGMINTFNRIKIFGTGDAKSLSGGISEALITTEFGLIVAIPSLLLFALLSREAKSFLSLMEKQSISFINGLKAHRERKAA